MGNSVTGDNYEIVKYKAYAIGDVNKDGKITIVDAESIQKYVADLEKSSIMPKMNMIHGASTKKTRLYITAKEIPNPKKNGYMITF